MKKTLLTLALVILLAISGSVSAQAKISVPKTKTVTGGTPLGGFSKMLSECPVRYTDDDLNVLSIVMMIENGDSTDECILLTGSVVLNRVKNNEYPDTIRGVIFDGYNSPGPQQYATVTVKGVEKNVAVPERIRRMAAFLLVFGPICPENVLFQSGNPSLGKENYKTIGKEYFAYG